jgi:hypothetical protein
MDQSKNQNDKIAKFSIALILIENGIGSILHAFKIPLAGQLMSINQIGILSRALVQTSQKNSPLLISFNTSMLKSLGPAGKKLTPMLAILTQGILFSFPTYLLGINVISIILGIILSSLWAFIQPAILYYLLFGSNFLLMIESILKDFQKIFTQIQAHLLHVLAFVIILKVTISLIYSFFFIRINQTDYENILTKFKKYNVAKKTTQLNPIKSALNELFSPLFIISLIFTLVFLLFNNASYSTIIWSILRPIALGIIIFYTFKIITINKIVLYLEKKNLKSLAIHLKATMDLLHISDSN